MAEVMVWRIYMGLFKFQVPFHELAARSRGSCRNDPTFSRQPVRLRRTSEFLVYSRNRYKITTRHTEKSPGSDHRIALAVPPPCLRRLFCCLLPCHRLTVTVPDPCVSSARPRVRTVTVLRANKSRATPHPNAVASRTCSRAFPVPEHRAGDRDCASFAP